MRFEDGGSPFQLIRMAEEFDLIEELDHAIAEMAVKRLAADRTGAIKLAINVSGRTIVNEGFVDHIDRLLARSDVAKGRLIFEITETCAIDDLPRANQHIQALRAPGLAGLPGRFRGRRSSFAYLQELSLDIVKIDGRYVRELAGNGRDRSHGPAAGRAVPRPEDPHRRRDGREPPRSRTWSARPASTSPRAGCSASRPTSPQPALKLAPVTPAAPTRGRVGGLGVDSRSFLPLREKVSARGSREGAPR